VSPHTSSDLPGCNAGRA